jgi:hypothetical protein
MKITIPIRGSDFETAYESYELFLEEIPKLSNNQKLISLIDSKERPNQSGKPLIEKISFQIITEDEEEEEERNACIEIINHNYPVFRTDFITEYFIIDLQIIDEEIFPPDPLSFLVNNILNRLCFLINLSYSSNVDFINGVIYSNSNKYIAKTKMIGSSIMFAYEHAVKINWPIIKSLNLIDTIDWYLKFDIHPDDKSTNRAHRAINSFSQLIDNLVSRNSDYLFWVMLGIEALLAEDIQGISKQIREKSTLILGKPTEYTSKLNKLYDYRSRLVHGNYNIFPRFYSEYETYEEEYEDYLAFATSILIALIRELIKSQKIEFEFELKLK